MRYHSVLVVPVDLCMTYTRRSLLAPALAALCLLLAACGQKGPLYLPGEGSEIETEISLPDQVDDEEARQEDEEAVDGDAR